MKKFFQDISVNHVIIIVLLITIITYISFRRKKLSIKEEEKKEDTKPLKYYSLKEILKKRKISPEMFTVIDDFKKLTVNDKGKKIAKKFFEELNETISEDSELLGTLLMLKTKGDFAVIEWLYNDYIYKGKKLLIPELKKRMYAENWTKAKKIIENLPMRF